MENKLIKTKIENLIEKTKQLKIHDVISYIKIEFPENELSCKTLMKETIFIMIIEILFI